MKTWMMAVVIVGATALTASAHPGGRAEALRSGPGRPEGGRPRFEMLLEDEQAMERIGISADQVAALRARFADAEKTTIKLRAEVELAEAELRRLLKADPVDRAVVMRALDAASAAHLALRRAMIEERLAFREIVGPETAKRVRRHIVQSREGESRPGPRADRRGPPMEE